MSEIPETFAAGITDATPDLDAETFDFEAWVAGVTPTVRAVKVYAAAHLLEQVDDLERRLRVAESIPATERGITDESPDQLRQQLLDVATQFEASAKVFKVQGRSDDYVARLKARLKEQGITDEGDVTLHQLADAIISPRVTVDGLRRLGEVSEPQLKTLITASALANYQPPRVDVPFSSGSSKTRAGRGS